MTPDPQPPPTMAEPLLRFPSRRRRPPTPAVNRRLRGLPGRNRSEKRANAKAAQKAYLADKRSKS